MMANVKQGGTPRELAQQQFKAARSNLLLMVIFTVVNIVLLYTGSESMLLFSASIPYILVAMGVFGGNFELFVFGMIVSVVLIVLYFLCWLLSKKHPGWLIVALVLFILDILAMVGLFLLAEEASGIVDVLFHGWVLYYLIIGIISAAKLKKMPAEEPVVEAVAVEDQPVADPVPLHRIGEDEKCRILLEHTYGSYRIVYRRVKRTNQLVINDYIYDQIELLAEPAHSLSARIGGHEIVVGFDGAANCYCTVDGEQVAKKMRLF